MSKRITRKDLEMAVKWYSQALDNFEALDGTLVLQLGSNVNGVAYRLTYQDGGQSPLGISSGFLGMTAREAYDRLTIMTAVLGDLKYRNDSL